MVLSVSCPAFQKLWPERPQSQVYLGARHLLNPTPLCYCVSAKEAFWWQGTRLLKW